MIIVLGGIIPQIGSSFGGFLSLLVEYLLAPY